MGPATVVGALAALTLFGVGVAMHHAPRVPGRRAVAYRGALPWIAGSMILAATALTSAPFSPVVIAGLTIYTGLAVAAVWRMASLDRASVWMVPSRRLVRFGLSSVGLIWLGLMLGLLLWIADMVAGFAVGG